ncbi:MAG: Gfo/Idh/MocA family oxidoreductase [Bacteroidota bacterium]
MTTRREFIRKSSLGIGAATLSTAAFTSLSPACAQAADRSLGIALVGLGNYATNQLLPALQETKHIKLAGIVTGTPSKAEKWQSEQSLKASNIYNYETYDQLADNPEIDVVYVVLPNSMHAEYTIRALEAGKHVICEKPMGLSVAECDQMIAAAKKADKTLAIGYRLHYEPHNQEAMRLAGSDEMGKVKLFEGGFGFQSGDPNQWRLKKALAGGGALMDVGIYVLQAARFTTGEEPIAVTAQEFKTDPVKFAEVDETIFWQMEFPSGAIASCTTSYNARTEYMRVACEKGRFEMGPCYGYGGIRGSVNNKEMDFPAINQQAAHMDGIAQHILTGEPLLNVGGEEGRRDMLVIEAIYKAIETGGRVEIAR